MQKKGEGDRFSRVERQQQLGICGRAQEGGMDKRKEADVPKAEREGGAESRKRVKDDDIVRCLRDA